jgi:hypothetical protein
MTKGRRKQQLIETPNAAEIAACFIQCLEEANRRDWPYSYWLLENALPEETVDDIGRLPIAAPTGLLFYGKREINNASRVYFTPENQDKHPVCREMATAFKSAKVLQTIEDLTGRDVSKGSLRIEYCQDTDGFWLEPHVDIPVKLFSMLVYLSDDLSLRDAGTDIYDATPQHKTVATAPYEKNRGLIFIPAHDTWHGFSKRPIKGLRKSLIINYVAPEWRDKWELS